MIQEKSARRLAFLKPRINDQTFLSKIVFVAHNKGWLNDKTFAREANRWKKMFDLDQIREAI